MAQSRTERLEKQRLRQREYRKRRRAERRPSRDDIARAALHRDLTQAMNDEDHLDALADRIVPVLVEQGFDRRAVHLALEDLVDRYRGGWNFQRRFVGDRSGDDDDEGGEA